MRPIDADKLRADVFDWENCYNGFSDTYDKAMIIDAIDEQPTIEAEPNTCEYWDSESHFCALRRPQAEPVRRGRWIWLSHGVFCSRCNYKLQTTGLPSYCPNCGAKMENDNE